MILVDSSIWIDHLRTSDDQLVGLLNRKQVLTHPFVIGELALGKFKQRDLILSNLEQLPTTKIASSSEILYFIDRHQLFGTGIGYVDAGLLTAVRITNGASLWTRDRRLRDVASRLGLAAG